MVLEGSPELPGDPGDGLHTNGLNIINHGQNTSDESDGEDTGHSYEGYEPLPLVDNPDDLSIQGTNLQDEEYNDPNLPHITNSDIEMERQVWSEPRPQELNLELDSTRAEQIISVMANITLPSSAIPAWAQGVPEERWKQDLLERIRQRKDTCNTISAGDKEDPIT